MEATRAGTLQRQTISETEKKFKKKKKSKTGTDLEASLCYQKRILEDLAAYMNACRAARVCMSYA